MVNNDNIQFLASTSATSLSGVGIYPILATALGVGINNYELIIINSSLSITPRVATVTGDNATKIYGEPNPTFTGTILGIINDDDIAFSASTAATQSSPVGTYPITISATGPNISNYSLSIINSTLSINQATLTVTADNLSKIQGEANPELTGTIVGVKNNDDIQFSASTEATESSPVGDYPILATATGASINNYELIIINSTLSILPKVGTQAVEGFKTRGLKITPNPNDGHFEVASAENGRLFVYNSLGIEVAEIEVIKGTNKLSLSLSSGIYLLKLGSKTLRMTVE